ncbi:MAG: hypothetical protein E7080_05375 [Bacteroidales bacterium]|nr:hypothetical protein [Bacteroidales bacterium]
MGFFSDLFLGDKCKFCGNRSLNDDLHHKTFSFQMRYCNSCKRLGIYGEIPRCYRCGTPQTSYGQNEYNVWLPKCPKCGYIWDDD